MLIFIALTNIKHVFGNILADYKPRLIAFLIAAKAQTTSLTNRVVHQTGMLTNYLAINGFHVAGLCWQILAQEFTEMTIFSDKADSYRVFLISNR